MIKIDDITKIVKLTMISGCLKGVKPLSLLVIGEAGIGKTEIITGFSSPKILFLTDLSYMGLLKELKENKDLTHIIIPDFIKITQKKRSTADNLISLLNALTEDGVGKISLCNFNEDFQGRKMGIITSTTKASFHQNKQAWNSIGFLDRFLVCSYSYSSETIDEIIKYINEEKYLSKKIKEKVKITKKIDIRTKSSLNEKLNVLIHKRFRTLKALQSLVKCNAILRGSDIVENIDIDEVSRLSKYLNLDFNPI
jgi:hypothetical protein